MNLELINDPKYAERFQAWIRISQLLAEYEPFLAPQIQYIGELDIECFELEKRIVTDVDQLTDDEKIKSAMTLTDAFNRGYSWVTGFYEAIRTAHQRVKEKVILLRSESNSDMKEVEGHLRRQEILFQAKVKLERLRIPLAKMEQSARFKVDSHIAYPAISANGDIAWQIQENVFIERGKLSNEVIDLLKKL